MALSTICVILLIKNFKFYFDQIDVIKRCLKKSGLGLDLRLTHPFLKIIIYARYFNLIIEYLGLKELQLFKGDGTENVPVIFCKKSKNMKILIKLRKEIEIKFLYGSA
ncbi:hypothetical protein BpHYR1_038195 [Brachionus plicatilis]|uniref:Uncharacterized protein n=1 Tax=Brachionus plicatilis TaxID=10195 RepID=A0A3M7TBB2_BRAPC|nr:hypothetical protein BpHYR1_038195 [Brachionus plicatilis]